MISLLQDSEREGAIHLYMQGTLHQQPPGCFSYERAKQKITTHITYLYKEKGVYLGLLVCSIQNTSSLTLDFIYAVEPRKGIGTLLLLEAKKFALSKDIHTIFCSVSAESEGAKSFYKANGFIKGSEEIKFSGKRDFLLYTLTLSF